MKQVGILLDNLGASQLAYLAIQYVNLLVRESNQYDFIFLYENMVQPCIKPYCGQMNLSECWNISDTLLSTSLSTAKIAQSTVSPAKHVFYVWDLEWMRRPMPFKPVVDIYRGADVLIARSQKHASVLENYTNRKPLVIEQFNLKEIIEVI